MKTNNLSRTIRELTGKPTDDGYPYELGPGFIFIVELPSRVLCAIDPKDDAFPKSFYNMTGNVEIWDELVAPESRDSYLKSWNAPFESNKFRYQILTSKRSATMHVCEYRVPLYNTEGKLVGAMCRVIDDSFRALAMDALVRRSWKEIATKMNRHFLHDFNNTIAGIYSLSELYAEPGSDPQSMTEAMEHIRNSSIRSQELTRKIRMLTTLEDGEPSYFTLEKLVKDQDDYIRALLPKNAKVEYELDENQTPVFLDANRFRQAILHLASNSQDAAGEDVEILIRVVGSKNSGRAKMARIDFCDNGTGFTEAEITKVLSPFFTNKDEKKHPGLGLSIVKSFAETFGGDIEIQNVEKGAVVSLYIPELETETILNTSGNDAKNLSLKPTLKSKKAVEPLNIAVYTWEDITRHPLLLAMRNAGWKIRVHLDPGQLLIDLAQADQNFEGVLVFKSTLDEKVEPLLSELEIAKNCPPIALIALGESVEAIPESAKRNCGLVASGTSKPTALLNKLAKFYR